MRFAGKVAIITGAGSGIGAATAKRFWQEGAAVVLCGRTREKLDRVAAELSEDRSLIHVSDVSLPADMTQLASKAIERFGRLDVLVNNAGIGWIGEFLELAEEDWHRILATNLNGVFYATRAALPHLLETKGTIVNVSSLAGLGGDRGLAFYDTSKGAVCNLTRSLALEFGGRGVRINAVCPTTTLTDLTIPIFERNPEALARLLARIPMGRAAQPEEVASAIAFLASEDASFINGVNLPVDGGTMASNGQASFL